MAITPVNFNETAPRYTTVEAVKGRLAIPPADVTKDAAIQSAIVAAELAIDIFMERALPDTDDPPDSPAVITIVPDAISQSALQTAIADFQPGAFFGDEFCRRVVVLIAEINALHALFGNRHRGDNSVEFLCH